MLETSGLWVTYVRLEDPPGLSPITNVGRFATVDAAQVATDELGSPVTHAYRQFGAHRGGNSRRGACSCERVGLAG